LPTLQDMLLIDEEFDAGKLEELAESLLADITAGMGAGNREGNETPTQTPSNAERLPRPMVGTTTKSMESNGYNESLATESGQLKITLPTQTLLPLDPELNGALTLESELHESAATHTTITSPAAEAVTKLNANTSPATICANLIPDSIPKANTMATTEPPETLYGTYDAKTNSITIVLSGDEPVSEAVEEIYSDETEAMGSGDDEDAEADDNQPPCIGIGTFVKVPSPMVAATSPPKVYFSIDDTEEDLHSNPITQFLRPKGPMVSPLAKSPALSIDSVISDHGYESIIGSPNHDMHTMDDFAWNESFQELFPSLV